MTKLRFLTTSHIKHIKQNYHLPVFVYSEKELTKQAQSCLNFPNTYGLTVRYAMKANSNLNILRIFDNLGLHIDASSEFEVYRAINAGIDVKKIQLTGQEIPDGLEKLLKLGIHYNATSLLQLEKYGKLHPNTNIGVRINPGIGSGGTKRTSTGGIASSFGIRYKYIDKIKDITSKYNLTINKIHTHIGSGSDPKIRAQTATISLNLLKHFDKATTLDLGGGFKIDRINDKNSINLKKVGEQVNTAFIKFAQQTGRKIHLEIEPGTFLLANAGAIIGQIEDIVDTDPSNYTFLKTNIGMTEIARPTLYGAQHPITVINSSSKYKKYVVVGACCESGDILTTEPGNPELICPIRLKESKIGDIIVVEGAGAYCSSMCFRNYNSYPSIAELLITLDGTIHLIKKEERINDLRKNEIKII